MDRELLRELLMEKVASTLARSLQGWLGKSKVFWDKAVGKPAENIGNAAGKAIRNLPDKNLGKVPFMDTVIKPKERLARTPEFIGKSIKDRPDAAAAYGALTAFSGGKAPAELITAGYTKATQPIVDEIRQKHIPEFFDKFHRLELRGRARARMAARKWMKTQLRP